MSIFFLLIDNIFFSASILVGLSFYKVARAVPIFRSYNLIIFICNLLKVSVQKESGQKLGSFFVDNYIIPFIIKKLNISF